MFKKRNLLSIFLILSFFIFGDIAMAVIPRAKVIFLGETGSGKTVLKTILTGKEPSWDYQHTVQLDMAEEEIKLPAFLSKKTVIAHFWDTSAEMRHRKIINKFSEGAHVAILCVAANTLFNSNFTKGIEDTMENLAKNASKCRIIIVLTKTKNDNQGNVTSPVQVNKARDYVKNVLIGQAFKNQVEGWYEFPSLDGDEVKKCRKQVSNLLVTALKNYGYNNFPLKADGMHGRIVEKLIDVDSVDFKSEEITEYEWVDEKVPDPSTCDSDHKKTITKKVPRLKVRKVPYTKHERVTVCELDVY